MGVARLIRVHRGEHRHPDGARYLVTHAQPPVAALLS